MTHDEMVTVPRWAIEEVRRQTERFYEGFAGNVTLWNEACAAIDAVLSPEPNP